MFARGIKKNSTSKKNLTISAKSYFLLLEKNLTIRMFFQFYKRKPHFLPNFQKAKQPQ